MSDVIQLLPDHVANQIAAGEVVQRPASVVKELLENAIDAGASTINLLIKDAGKTLIQVSDDGMGMSTTDARLAFERHATSKIKEAKDLFALNTKGFRGEALASIAAISHVELKSKKEAEETGTHLILKGSEVLSQDPCVTPKGTVVSVKNLFYNLPARRNFLKSKSVETRHIIDEFQRVALAHPKVGFSMHHNDSELFKLPKSNRRQRIVGVFGGKTNEKLVPVDEETQVVKINGFIGKPEFARRTKGEQFFFVNRRFIKNRYLHHAISSAYEGLLKDKKYPSYFLYFRVDPQKIDINIHPTKTEVKFDDEQSIYAILRSAVRHSLGQFNVAPSLDFDRDSDLEVPYNFKHKNPSSPKVEVDPDFNPFKDEASPHAKPNFSSQNRASWEALYTGLKSGGDNVETGMEFESEAVTGDLFDDQENGGGNDIFQLQKKYIVSPLKESLLVVHQHRAHFRILFEEFLDNIASQASLSQQLLFPLELELSGQEMNLLKEIKSVLEQTGFDFSELKKDKIEITGIPNMVSEGEVVDLLDRVLADIERGVPQEKHKSSAYLAQTLANNMAIKTGVSLNPKELSMIINRLFACETPNFTPTGENILIQLKAEDLDKKFT